MLNHPAFIYISQHAFQIDARILAFLLEKYIPETKKFMDVSSRLIKLLVA